MMRDQLLRDIIDGLSNLQRLIENRTVARLNDINDVVGEAFMRGFLSGLRTLSLENLNQDGNFPAIDLGDRTARVSFQVTSTHLARKIQDTIDTFERHGLQKSYDELTVVVLGEKQKVYSTVKASLFTFDPERHIIDIKNLIAELDKADNLVLGRLRSIVEDAGLLGTPRRDTDSEAALKICAEFDRDALKHHWHQEGPIEDFRDALTELTDLLGNGKKGQTRVTVPLREITDPNLARELAAVKSALSTLRGKFNEKVNSGEIRDGMAYFKDSATAAAMNSAKQNVLDKVNLIRLRLGQPEIRMNPW